MLTGKLQLSMLFIHVVIELLLGPSVCLWNLGIEGVNVITVFAFDIAPLGRHVVVLAVQGHAVLPVAHKAALVTVNNLQHLPVLILLVLPHLSDCRGYKLTIG